MPSRKAYQSFLKHMNDTMYYFSIANSSLVVNLNGKIHRPVKRIIHLSICDRKLANFSRTKMKINNYIMAFNTKKKYGITYASFGLMTMSSFVKQKTMDILWNEIIPFKRINYIQRYIRNYYPTEVENWKMYYQSKQIKLYYFIVNIPICNYIRHLTVIIINIVQVFIIGIDLCIIFMHIHFVYYIWNHQTIWFASPIWGTFNFIFGKIMLLSLDISILIFIHVCVIMAYLGTISTIAMAIKLNQIRNLLYRKHLKMPSRRTYQSFLKHMSDTMIIFSVANLSLGKALFTYIIVNCPINCVVIVAILNGVPNSLVVNLNAKIHRPVKRIIHLSICDRKLANFSRTKIKIHNYIMAFNTKKKYGITYASFGLMTMFSFVKFILLYVEENTKTFTKITQIKCLQLLITVKEIHFLYLFFLKPVTIDQKMVHYDFGSLANVPFINGGAFLLYFNAIYCLDILYIKPVNMVTNVFNSIIIKRDGSFFIEKQYRSYPICIYFRYMLICIINMIDIGFIFTHIHLTYYIWINRFDWFADPLSGISNLLLSEFFLFLSHFFIIIYAHASIMVAIMGVFLRNVMSVKLKQIRNLMKLKVHNYNVAFHTSKKYGITYSSFGLISFSSFAKFKISKPIDNDVDLVPYIYGGRNATDGEVPWQVAIQNEEFTPYLCGGSILTEWWIVTSAYCLTQILQREMYIRYNTLSLESGQMLAVGNIIQHPNYNQTKNENNIGLIKTYGQMVLGRPNANSIPLPIAYQGVSPNLTINISGWGWKDKITHKFADTLQIAELITTTKEDCKTHHPEITNVNVFCAKSINNDQCISYGNAGGPGVGNNVLLGILDNYYPDECKPEFYELLTDVSQYVQWIVHHINNNKDVDFEPYIYGGRNATDGEVPWQVAIQNEEFTPYLCGGSILTEWWIITSAWCLNPILQTNMYIQYNTLSLKSGQMLAVSKIIQHPNYNKTNNENNIGLIKTYGQMVLGRPNANPIPLPIPDYGVLPNLKINISGWGWNDKFNPNFADTLQIAELITTNKSDCETHHPETTHFNVFCAKSLNNDKCVSYGDAGGPGVVNIDIPLNRHNFMYRNNSKFTKIHHYFNKNLQVLQFKISKSIDKDLDFVPYIYGGRNATDGEVPWQVAIQNTGISEFLCGGSILTEWWIVTSAFCLNPILQTGMYIRYNTLSIKSGQMLAVSRIIQHPNYNQTRNENNIGLIKTYSQMVLGRPNANPIPLPIPDYGVLPNLRINISGWGWNDKFNPKFADTLQIAELITTNKSDCETHHPETKSKNIFCAKSINNDVCTSFGDAGGPGIEYHASWKLIKNYYPTKTENYKIFVCYNLTCSFDSLYLDKSVELLKVHNYIMAFHTNKKYGITYASIGLITMFSFVKTQDLTLCNTSYNQNKKKRKL
ncbi:hypothetical protein BLOT_012153 [Blomia tropicalis]|nr:hypothetical protein BLOT_012153 [Blomia tropicalis]